MMIPLLLCVLGWLVIDRLFDLIEARRQAAPPTLDDIVSAIGLAFPTTPAPAPPVADHTLAFLAVLRDAQALIERIANPPQMIAADAPQPLPDIATSGFLTTDVLDPTDDVPWLFDRDAAVTLPDRQVGDAPPIVAHPLGIPGLEVPHVNGHPITGTNESVWSGHRDRAAFDVVH